MNDPGLHASLRAFIDAAKAKGASDRFLSDLLKSSGWADKKIFSAFRQYYEEATGLALPVRRESGESARDAFFYLIAFSTLATWTIALGSLLFRLIDRWFPDPVTLRGAYYPYQRLDLSFQIACILVAFPVFMYVSRRINRIVADEPRNRNSGVRKWLTYLALVIAASVLICDAVAVLAYFLQGEVTLRFVFKVIVVGAIAAGVFGYYLGEVVEAAPRRRKIFGTAAIAAVVAAIVLGFTATGGPSTQRAAQADVQRVRDLHHIAEAIRNSVLNGRAALPERLDQVPAAGGYNPRITDPETGAAYEYRKIPSAGSTTAYELCATFAFDNKGEAQQRRSTFWVHTAGRQCFPLDAKNPTPSEY